MLVNIPYMEHMGIYIYIYFSVDFPPNQPAKVLGSEDNANIWMDKWIEDTLLKPSLEEQAQWALFGGMTSSIPTAW
jgi:hypothetical protein